MSEEGWNPDRYESDHSYVYEYGKSLIDMLPKEGQRILDIGCGTGRLTKEIDRRGPEAVGIDNSEEMVQKARQNHPEVDFLIGDARGLSFECEFDAVFSNAALHWIPEKDQSDVISSIADSVRDGGRFVAELGGSGNIHRILGAIREELEYRGYEYKKRWYFPSIGEYTHMLEKHFEVRRAELFYRPTKLGGEDGLRSWLKMYGDGMF